MELNSDSIHKQVPYYLTDDAKVSLVRALEDFPRNTEYYLKKECMDALQGDGWTSLQIIEFESGERKGIKGIILSNTCDIAPENKRDVYAKLNFVPIVKCGAFASLLRSSGVNKESVLGKLEAIREQKVYSIFFLPAGGDLNEDYIALLDDVHTIPASVFFAVNERKKLFTLSQVGFYIFVFKLSVHFCRFHEGVHRTD